MVKSVFPITESPDPRQARFGCFGRSSRAIKASMGWIKAQGYRQRAADVFYYKTRKKRKEMHNASETE
jgi:hypothetical protein